MVGTNEDCLGCRLVSGFGCLAIGTYVIFQGRKVSGYQTVGFTIIGSCKLKLK